MALELRRFSAGMVKSADQEVFGTGKNLERSMLLLQSATVAKHGEDRTIDELGVGVVLKEVEPSNIFTHNEVSGKREWYRNLRIV